jgi:hypothetical protein
MAGLKLNLGCGAKRLPGYVNVDRVGNPDVTHDLETFPWPWADDSVSEILLVHVLEHLGQAPATFLSIMMEMYRVCEARAKIRVVVPHHRHDHFAADPTHVRAITPLGLTLFSQRLNREWLAKGASNTPLGLHLGVDFEVLQTTYKPSAHWYRLHPEPQVDSKLLLAESALYNNLVEELDILLDVIK